MGAFGQGLSLGSWHRITRNYPHVREKKGGRGAKRLDDWAPSSADSQTALEPVELGPSFLFLSLANLFLLGSESLVFFTSQQPTTDFVLRRRVMYSTAPASPRRDEQLTSRK